MVIALDKVQPVPCVFLFLYLGLLKIFISNLLTNKRSVEKVTDYYGRTYSNDDILAAINK